MKKFDTYIIAEIGINHNGSLDIAKKLIDTAVFAGCNAVKFQKRNPDLSVPKDQKYLLKETPWGTMTYLDYKHYIEFDKEQYDEIDRYCKERKIDWTASVWDMDSLEFMDQYNVPFIKVPSALLVDDKLLVQCVKRFPKVMVSTGMSTQQEIDHAVEVLRDAKIYFKKNNPIGLLHCNSSYPAPIQELNLSGIKTLTQKYPDFEIGYSGHEFRLGTTVSSIYLGATIIERHITLDRSMWGTDQLCSVEPQGLIKMVKGIRELEQAYGNGNIVVSEEEKKVKEKLRG